LRRITVTVPTTIDASGWLSKYLEGADGDTGKAVWEAQAEFEFAVFLCGPDVASVEIRRQLGVRIADVRIGPGWLAVLWTNNDPAEVLAFTGPGTQTFSWTPPIEAT
jgi:hypothetical protein